jgi:hypothetical protein
VRDACDYPPNNYSSIPVKTHSQKPNTNETISTMNVTACTHRTYTAAKRANKSCPMRLFYFTEILPLSVVQARKFCFPWTQTLFFRIYVCTFTTGLNYCTILNFKNWRNQIPFQKNVIADQRVVVGTPNPHRMMLFLRFPASSVITLSSPKPNALSTSNSVL